MLPLPETGVRSSRTSHNCDLQLFCDWLEGCLLFKNEPRVSRTDVIDLLCEEDIYDDQHFASDWLDNVWSELQRRQLLLSGAAPFEVGPRVIVAKRTWDKVPAYAFCVLAPLLQRSAKWGPRTKADSDRHYAAQGLLFERISEESLQAAGWETWRTGWSSTSPARLPSVVAGVAQRVGEPEHLNWTTNVSPNMNEAGLDVVFFRSFADGRCGVPIHLVQCAAGADWDTKLHTPVMAIWRKLVDFSVPPQKAFALPHSLGPEQLRRTSVKVEGMVFDRYRLHDRSRPIDWCSKGLANDIKSFLRPLIAKLPNHA